jgi:hypothetical protein
MVIEGDVTMTFVDGILELVNSYRLRAQSVENIEKPGLLPYSQQWEVYAWAYLNKLVASGAIDGGVVLDPLKVERFSRTRRSREKLMDEFNLVGLDISDHTTRTGVESRMRDGDSRLVKRVHVEVIPGVVKLAKIG